MASFLCPSSQPTRAAAAAAEGSHPRQRWPCRQPSWQSAPAWRWPLGATPPSLAGSAGLLWRIQGADWGNPWRTIAMHTRPSPVRPASVARHGRGELPAALHVLTHRVWNTHLVGNHVDEALNILRVHLACVAKRERAGAGAGPSTAATVAAAARGWGRPPIGAQPTDGFLCEINLRDARAAHMRKSPPAGRQLEGLRPPSSCRRGEREDLGGQECRRLRRRHRGRLMGRAPVVAAPARTAEGRRGGCKPLSGTQEEKTVPQLAAPDQC